jgi:hypothetical protein
MRLLLAHLVEALSGEHATGHRDTRPDGMSSRDWTHNLDWARRRVNRYRRRSQVQASRHPILSALVFGLPFCSTCHTPLLVGGRLDEKRITRRMRRTPFCSAACKMRARRLRSS